VARTGNRFGIAGVARQCRALPVRVLARLVRVSDGAVKGSGTAADVATGIRARYSGCELGLEHVGGSGNGPGQWLAK
jgi:hypothetical protein